MPPLAVSKVMAVSRITAELKHIYIYIYLKHQTNEAAFWSTRQFNGSGDFRGTGVGKSAQGYSKACRWCMNPGESHRLPKLTPKRTPFRLFGFRKGPAFAERRRCRLRAPAELNQTSLQLETSGAFRLLWESIQLALDWRFFSPIKYGCPLPQGDAAFKSKQKEDNKFLGRLGQTDPTFVVAFAA